MPRKPITFLGKTYKSQSEFKNYVKKIIYEEVGSCKDVKNKHPSKYRILIKILERHPDFTSKTENMCNLKIFTDKLNKKALRINIIKKNGDEIDISWRCAITGKPKSSKTELISAMRSSVDDQIYQFKKKIKIKIVSYVVVI